MIDRACISINNRCNLNCVYCHFHDKTDSIIPSEMNVNAILNNIRKHIEKYNIPVFKLGLVGNGEPFLDFDLLQSYVCNIEDLLDSGRIQAYTITNGTCVDETMLLFLKEHKVNVGFSLDGPRDIHNKYRGDTFDAVISAIDMYHSLYGQYPSINCTVGREAIENPDLMVAFFRVFNSRITFSRMIGELGISLEQYRIFLKSVQGKLNIRTGGYDCTMYGGLCGAGINNVFFANQRVYICGNCIDLDSFPYTTPLDEIEFSIKPFDRHYCFKETLGL